MGRALGDHIQSLWSGVLSASSRPCPEPLPSTTLPAMTLCLTWAQSDGVGRLWTEPLKL